MSPGRASSALTIWRLFLPASALRTQVWTAAQPLPSILWPACSSDQVTKLAHHGLPGPTFAAARYLSTSAPVFVALLVHAELGLRDLQRRCAGAAAARARCGRGGGVDHARHRRGRRQRARGPGGGWAARKMPEAPFLLRSTPSAAAAMNWPDWPVLGSGGAAAAAAAGAPGRGGAARRGPGGGRGAAGAAAAAARPARRRRRRRPAAPSSCRSPLEGDVDVVLVGGVGEVAGPADRPRRADLVRAVLLRQRRELGGQLARGGRAGGDDLAVDAWRCRARGRRSGWRSSRRW